MFFYFSRINFNLYLTKKLSIINAYINFVIIQVSNSRNGGNVYEEVYAIPIYILFDKHIKNRL